MRRRRSRRLAAERLEQRLVLTADLGGLAAAGIDQIDWQGLSVAAYQDRWIVDFDSNEAGQPLAAVVAETAPAGWGVTSLGDTFYSLVAPGAGVDQVSLWAADAPGIVAVEPDFVVTPTRVSNDPGFSQLWGLSNTGQSSGLADADIDAPEAWSITTGSRSVVIAVIDSGVDVNHPDLAANIWRNPREIAGNGIDDDGNGFVDDVNGWDFVSNDNTPQDGDGHGTHVAGTIGAVGDNGQGVVGVNWEVSLLPLRFLDDSGSGSTADAIAAINYATALRNAGVNVVASNNSWGGGGFSSSLRTAISRHNDAGIVFVAAAGNDGSNNDAIPAYPASYDLPNVISVAALDRSDRLANFSNYGRTSVDLGAPGVSIYSTTPGNRYSTYNGTSMAAPHVAGVVGLLAAANPQATVAEIRAAILDTVVPVPALGSGKTATGGRLNAAAAVERIAPVAGPRVRSVSPSGEVAPPVSEVRVVFSEEILAASIVPGNFQLVAAGGDGRFGTADDAAVAIPASGISQSPAGTVVIQLGEGLADDSYRLTLVGTGGNPLRNLAGEPLLNGQDQVANFVVNTPPPAPLEPNDTLANATVGLPAGMPESGFAGVIGDGVNGPRDVDLFSVRLAAGELLDVAIIAQAAGSSLDSYLRVFNAAGVQLAANDDNATSLDSRLTFAASTAGTYYVDVSGYGNTVYSPASGADSAVGSTGAYTVTFQRTTPPLEPNDSIGQATPVAVTANAASFTALVGDGAHGSRDVDLFAVDLVATQQITLAVVAAATGSSLDSYLRLFDAAGRQLAANDDSAASLDSSLVYTAAATGLYYVGVSGYGNAAYTAVSPGSGTSGSTGPYRLDITLSEVIPPEPPPENPGEPNDTLATATVGLAAGGTTAALVGVIGDGVNAAADVDLFSVMLEAGDVLEAAVRAQAVGSSLDSYLRLFDSAGVQLAANDDFGGSLDSGLSFTAAAAGAYYVGVSGYGNARYAPVTGTGVVAGPVGEFELLLRRTPRGPVGPLEPNDSLATATPVSPVNGGVELSGMIGDGDHGRRDVDLFAVALAADETLIADVSAWNAGSSLDSYLRLFTSAGEQVAANDDFGGSLDSRLEFVAPAAGTYYLGLSGYRNSRYDPRTTGSGTPGSTGSYTLAVEVVGVESPPQPEPGGTLDTAAAGLGAEPPDAATFVGVVGDGEAGNRDVDLYSVVLQAGQSLSAVIRARVVGSSLDSYLRLFNAAGSQVAFNDDFGGSQDSQLSYTAPTSGTYYVGVSGFGNSVYVPADGRNTRTGSTGAYNLSLTRTTPPLEPNDSIGQATTVVLAGDAASFEAFVGDGIFAARDVDLYAISLAVGDVITLDVTARDAGSTLDSYLRLFGPAGQQVAFNDDAGGSWDSYLQFTATSAGVYFVGVSGFLNSRYAPTLPGSGVAGSTGDYRLDISVSRATASSVRGAVFSAVAAAAGDERSASNGRSNMDLFRLIALLASPQTAFSGS